MSTYKILVSDLISYTYAPEIIRATDEAFGSIKTLSNFDTEITIHGRTNLNRFEFVLTPHVRGDLLEFKTFLNNCACVESSPMESYTPELRCNDLWSN